MFNNTDTEPKMLNIILIEYMIGFELTRKVVEIKLLLRVCSSRVSISYIFPCWLQ